MLFCDRTYPEPKPSVRLSFFPELETKQPDSCRSPELKPSGVRLVTSVRPGFGAAPKMRPSVARGGRGWGQSSSPRDRPAAGQYGPAGGGPGARARTAPGAALPVSYAAFLIEPFMTADALLAASCKVLDDRWAYRAVTLESECPNSCCTSYKLRPEFTRNDAN